MINPKLALPQRVDIAEAIENGKRVALFEHPCAIVDSPRGGQNIKPVANTYELLRHLAYAARCLWRSMSRS